MVEACGKPYPAMTEQDCVRICNAQFDHHRLREQQLYNGSETDVPEANAAERDEDENPEQGAGQTVDREQSSTRIGT